MNKNFAAVVLFLLNLLPWRAHAQILPKEGSSLNYTLIGFSFPAKEGSSNYKLEIARGKFENESDFTNHISFSIHCKTNKVVARVPAFGTQYTWRVIYTDDPETRSKNQLYHFSTQSSPLVDTTVERLRILNDSGNYKEAYIFLDGNRALYDMTGQPVWFLPNISEIDTAKLQVSCLKLTPQGTITFIADGQDAYEINYNGDILWKGPNDGQVSGARKEFYHHEFTRLANGHYMVMGNENTNAYLKFKSPEALEGMSIFMSNQNFYANDTIYPLGKTDLATIIEYDHDGSVVWSYKTSNYVTGSDLVNRKVQGNMHDVNLKVHANSSYFDEKDSILYIGFRNINRIIKIKYPEGATLNTFGRIYTPPTQNMPVDPGTEQIKNSGKDADGNGLFCGQHYCLASKSGDLYVFNYGATCLPGAMPRISRMKQTGDYIGGLEKVWEYVCQMEDADVADQYKLFSTPGGVSGGNVDELPDGSLFASMTTSYSKVFIVNMNKDVLWSAMSEKWDPEERKWKMLPSYRASIIPGREDVEKLVWHTVR